MRLSLAPALLAALCLVTAPAQAATITLDFESFFEFDSPGIVSTGVGDVSFGDSTVMTGFLASGGFGNLNDDDYPPRSGMNVLSNLVVDFNAGTADPGPMSIGFQNPLYSFLGYFTYSAPVTLMFTLADASTQTVFSQYSSNLLFDFLDPITQGAPPNEAISFSSSLGIIGVAITLGIQPSGAPGYGSLVLDDLTLSTDFPSQAAVPEPGTLLLMGTGLAAVARRARRRAPQDRH